MRQKNKISSLVGTDSRGRQNGSVSVEASLAFPLFFFSVMLLARLFLLMLTEISVAKAVTLSTDRMAPVFYAERSVLRGKVAATSLTYYSELLEALGSYDGIENLRIICLDDAEQNVRVTVSYDFPVQSPGFPGIRLRIRQSFLVHPFIGEYDPDQLSKEELEEKKDIVYITEGGQVYHLKKTCTYLFMPVEGVGIKEVKDRRNASGARYYLCERCDKERDTGMVYITSYGNKYHLTAKCPALFRDVKEVERASVSDRRPCSKCGKEQSGDN